MEKETLYLRDIMTHDVISVFPETPLTEAALIIAEHNFDGLPVVDRADILQGVLTEYDLLSKGFSLHLPTLQFAFKNLQFFRGHPEQFGGDIGKIINLKVKDVMNTDSLTLPEDATYESAVAAFRDHHRVNPIPIIDAKRRVVGVVSRFDILKPLRELSS